MICHLPTIRSDRAGYSSLAELAAETASLAASRLELDWSRVGFFDANMAAPLGSVLAHIADRFNAIEIVNVPPMTERILRKNRFLSQFNYAPMGDTYGTTIPYRRLQQSEEGLFEEYLKRHLRGKGIPRMTDGLGKVFKQKLFEVFQNAVIHSESELGIFVCGQWFPQKQKLDLTIADAGIGIRERVRRHFSNDKIGSVAAIRWAIRDRNTTKTGSQPGGLGLKLLHEFARMNKGRIHIVSRLGFYEFSGQPSFTKLENDFPGTAVTLEINTADTSAYCLASEVPSEGIF